MNEASAGTGSMTGTPAILDLNPPGTPAQREALIEQYQEWRAQGREMMATIAAAVVLTASTKKSIQGKTGRGTLPTQKDTASGKLLIPVAALVTDGILDPERPGQRARGAATGEVFDVNPYPPAPVVPAGDVQAAQDVAVATVTVDLNRHMADLRAWFEEEAGEREALIAQAAGAKATAEEARAAVEREREQAMEAQRRAEELAASLLEAAAQVERERAAREHAEQESAKLAERLAGTEARVTELEGAVTAAASSRRRGIFGG